MTSSKRLLADLDAIGEERRAVVIQRARIARRADRAIPAAVEAGVPIAEIARRAGYTRKAIYDLLRKLGIEHGEQ